MYYKNYSSSSSVSPVHPASEAGYFFLVLRFCSHDWVDVTTVEAMAAVMAMAMETAMAMVMKTAMEAAMEMGMEAVTAGSVIVTQRG
jgi:hypothetical protein